MDRCACGLARPTSRVAVDISITGDHGLAATAKGKEDWNGGWTMRRHANASVDLQNIPIIWNLQNIDESHFQKILKTIRDGDAPLAWLGDNRGRGFDVTDIVDKKFGMLYVVCVHSRMSSLGNESNNYEYFYRCLCNCGRQTVISRGNLRKRHTKSCGCLMHQEASDSARWTGHGKLSGFFWRDICGKATRGSRTLEFTLTIKEAWEIFESQDERCALTGWKLSINRSNKGQSTRTASLDRIDSTRGYVASNSQWVHKDVNKIKLATAQSDFIHACKEIIAYEDRKKSKNKIPYLPVTRLVLPRAESIETTNIQIYPSEFTTGRFDVNDIVGKRFGKLRVSNFHSRTINKNNIKNPYTYFYECVCDCDEITIVRRTDLRFGQTKSCGCLWRRHGREHPMWIGHGEISGSFWAHVRSNAEVRGISFQATIQEAWKLFESQGGRCALTGREICFDSDRRNNTASLDRIDSLGGYKTDNLQWVHKEINRMKWNYSTERFLEICRAVASYPRRPAACRG
jgi:hypothetical protein